VTSQTYRGSAPFNEPECQAVRLLLDRIHAISLNSNHTYGRLILRPPGAQFFGTTPDDDILKELGDAMAAFNGYRSQYSWQLYDTTGTTMDWGYGAHGSLSYTFEHATSFHPNYDPYIPDGYVDGGNREAFLLLAEAAGDPDNYSVISGRVVDPEGAAVAAEIRVGKTFDIPLWRHGDGTNPTGLPSITEVVDTAMETFDGWFDFRVNPSRRPYEPGDGVPYTVTAAAVDGRSAARMVHIERGKTVDLGDVAVS
jgi:carboxypeptidase T